MVAICPKTKQNIVETPTFFQPAEDGTDCKIQIAREMSGREITRDEAKLLIETGQVGPFDDFISKKSGKISPQYLPQKESIRGLQICQKVNYTLQLLNNNKTVSHWDDVMEESPTTHDWDVVIVGAGPVGGHTANLLSAEGMRFIARGTQ